MEPGRDACRRELRLREITDVHKANEFLRNEYIAEFNRKFIKHDRPWPLDGMDNNDGENKASS